MARIPTLQSSVQMLDIRTALPAQKTADPHYLTPEHRAWRAQVIKLANGKCQDPRCKTPHRTGIRLFADHVIELQDGGEPLDPANGLARCGSCHTRKTNEERSKRMARPSRRDQGGGA